jgi:hypothetical protein
LHGRVVEEMTMSNLTIDDQISRGREVVRRLCGIPPGQPAGDAFLTMEFGLYQNSSDAETLLTDADHAAITEWIRYANTAQ